MKEKATGTGSATGRTTELVSVVVQGEGRRRAVEAMSRLLVLPVQTHARLHPFERRRGEVAVLPGWAREKLEARLRPRAPATAEQAPLELGVPVVLDVVVQQEQ